TYTRAKVSTHNTPTSLWIIINNEIYDVTEFQKTHPGGDKSFSGKDATKAFKKTHNEKILKTDLYSKLCVGRV
ncbi:cytochrome b5, partial [Hyaloscypha hepaticicola]